MTNYEYKITDIHREESIKTIFFSHFLCFYVHAYHSRNLGKEKLIKMLLHARGEGSPVEKQFGCRFIWLFYSDKG